MGRRAAQKHHHANSTTFCMPFLKTIIIIIITHSGSGAGSNSQPFKVVLKHIQTTTTQRGRHGNVEDGGSGGKGLRCLSVFRKETGNTLMHTLISRTKLPPKKYNNLKKESKKADTKSSLVLWWQNLAPETTTTGFGSELNRPQPIKRDYVRLQPITKETTARLIHNRSQPTDATSRRTTVAKNRDATRTIIQGQECRDRGFRTKTSNGEVSRDWTYYLWWLKMYHWRSFTVVFNKLGKKCSRQKKKKLESSVFPQNSDMLT